MTRNSDLGLQDWDCKVAATYDSSSVTYDPIRLTRRPEGRKPPCHRRLKTATWYPSDQNQTNLTIVSKFRSHTLRIVVLLGSRIQIVQESKLLNPHIKNLQNVLDQRRFLPSISNDIVGMEKSSPRRLLWTTVAPDVEVLRTRAICSSTCARHDGVCRRTLRLLPLTSVASNCSAANDSWPLRNVSSMLSSTNLSRKNADGQICFM